MTDTKDKDDYQSETSQTLKKQSNNYSVKNGRSSSSLMRRETQTKHKSPENFKLKEPSPEMWRGRKFCFKNLSRPISEKL